MQNKIQTKLANVLCLFYGNLCIPYFAVRTSKYLMKARRTLQSNSYEWSRINDPFLPQNVETHFHSRERADFTYIMSFFTMKRSPESAVLFARSNASLTKHTIRYGKPRSVVTLSSRSLYWPAPKQNKRSVIATIAKYLFPCNRDRSTLSKTVHPFATWVSRPSFGFTFAHKTRNAR
jgi:hypothetical protein